MFQKLRSAIGSALQGSSNGGRRTTILSNTSVPPRRGTSEMLQMYRTSPWLRAVANKIAKDLGTTRWYVYRFPDRQTALQYKDAFFSDQHQRTERLQEMKREAVVERVDDHPLADLLFKGNSDLPGQIVFQITQLHMDLVGEAYWLIERDSQGRPAELWPLPPHWIRTLPNPDQPYYEVSMTGVTSGYAEIPQSEIIHFRDPDPAEPYGRGTGTASSLSDEVDVEHFTVQHVKSFFYNRARPDLVISGEGFSQEEAERAEQKWKEKHQGFMNQFKPTFINKEVDIHTINQTFESLQLANMREHERDIIVNTFSVPPEQLGILSNSNRSTIEAGQRHWIENVINSRLELLRTYIQRDLAVQFGSEPVIVDFHREELVDTDHRETIMRIMPFAFTYNDFRKSAGFPSWGKEGDVRQVPENMREVPVNNPNNEVMPSNRSQQLAYDSEEKRQLVLNKTQHIRKLLEEKKRDKAPH